MSFQIGKFIKKDGINIKNVKKRGFKYSITYYSSQISLRIIHQKKQKLILGRITCEIRSFIKITDPFPDSLKQRFELYNIHLNWRCA